MAGIHASFCVLRLARFPAALGGCAGRIGWDGDWARCVHFQGGLQPQVSHLILIQFVRLEQPCWPREPPPRAELPESASEWRG